MSQKKLDANRRNAARSTGPRTEAGKERASRNAVKHGLFCTGTGRAFYIPPGEDRDQFLLFEREMVRSLRPLNFAQRELALQAARVAWKLRARLPRAEEVHWDAALREEKEDWASVVTYQEVHGEAAKRRAARDVAAAAARDGKGDDPAAAQARADREYLKREDRAVRRGDRVAAAMPDELVTPGVFARAYAQAAATAALEETDRDGDPTPAAALGRLERYEMQLRRELQAVIRALTTLQKLQGMGEDEGEAEDEGASDADVAPPAQNEPTAAADHAAPDDEDDGPLEPDDDDEQAPVRNEANATGEAEARAMATGVRNVEAPAAAEVERAPAQNEPTAGPVTPPRPPSPHPGW